MHTISDLESQILQIKSKLHAYRNLAVQVESLVCEEKRLLTGKLSGSDMRAAKARNTTIREVAESLVHKYGYAPQIELLSQFPGIRSKVFHNTLRKPKFIYSSKHCGWFLTQ